MRYLNIYECILFDCFVNL